MRVVRHESPASRWEGVFAAPDHRLRPFVRGEYVGWTERADVPVCRREVPHPGVVLIVNFGEPFAIGDARHPRVLASFGSFVAGLHDRPVLAQAGATSSCVELVLTPLGAFRLLGVPMGALANRVVALEDVLGADARRLAEQLHEAPSWARRFARLDAALLARLAAGPEPHAEVRHVWAALEASDGGRPIAGLAREVRWSRRRLAERFREQVGVAPKQFARIVRFDRAMRQVKAGGAVRWAELAWACGYADQSHLVREFREFAGVSPTVLLERRLPDGGGLAGG